MLGCSRCLYSNDSGTVAVIMQFNYLGSAQFTENLWYPNMTSKKFSSLLSKIACVYVSRSVR